MSRHYRVRLEKPELWLTNILWFILVAIAVLGGIVGGLIMCIFGFFIIGLPLILMGFFFTLINASKVRKCMKFDCERCEKTIVAYKYEYETFCTRCGAFYDIKWEE
ncbi:hypothetical protein [Brevibacillus laterosporus]|uniref:hypothetical protein n=1 Tax=Brevibacillus laterosporus TaxID=1465 RepID=UPI003D1E88DD